jgi:hypothetical protein
MKRYLIAFAIVVIVAALAAGVWLLRPKAVIPAEVTRTAGFGVWYPRAGTLQLEVDQTSIKGTKEGADYLVNFVAKSPKSTLLFNEQAVPETMTDVPEVYQKLIEKMNGYSTLDTLNGTISLTKPTEFSGDQVAVFKARGTLVMIRAQQPLSTDDWRRLGNNLEIAEP